MTSKNKYLTPDQMAERWGISSRLVRRLCAEGRIPGALQSGKFWLVPADSKKPGDQRVVSGEHKRPTKKQLMLLNGLMNQVSHLFLVDLENDRYYDASKQPLFDNIEGVYSKAIEQFAFSGGIYREDVPKIIGGTTPEVLRDKLMKQDVLEYRCRCKGAKGIFERRLLCFSVCERREGIPIYVCVYSKKVFDGVVNKDADNYIYEYSHKLRTPINSLLGMLGIEEKNKENAELLEHLRKKERDAVQELLEVLEDMAERAGVKEHQRKSDGTTEISADALKGISVLLVEDNELNREIADFVLKDAGAKVTEARDGLEAWEIYATGRERKFDVILMDIQMPIMDGYETTRKIRESMREDAKTVPILAMSANIFQADIQAALSAGMNAYILKPLNGKDLVTAIMKAPEEPKK